jgi:hypothetical protein
VDAGAELEGGAGELGGGGEEAGAGGTESGPEDEEAGGVGEDGGVPPGAGFDAGGSDAGMRTTVNCDRPLSLRYQTIRPYPFGRARDAQ